MTAMLMFTGHASRDKTEGSFAKGVFKERRFICMPAHLIPEELEAKEKKFFQDNPDW